MRHPADSIRSCVDRVSQLRNASRDLPALDTALMWVKGFQARRFASTYADLLKSKEFGAASRFFLIELYGDKDFSLRDSQFARIASALEKYFPASVVDTAVALAELHALTEELDFAMAQAFLNSASDGLEDDSARYLACWRNIGRSTDREHQLNAVLNLGAELNRLTRIPGLRMMLRMMRRPAKAAGLDALQQFLEAGFDTFAAMSGRNNRAASFLETIADRERTWMGMLFTAPKDVCLRELRKCLHE